MKKRICITVDVEAQPHRADKNHIDRLIWGNIAGQNTNLGIGLMMDIASQHDIGITNFLDYVEYDLYGEELLDVGREILHKGHDLQLHHHAELFPNSFFEKHNIPRMDYMCDVSKEQCRVLLDYCMDVHAKVSSKPMCAQRTGSYRLSSTLLEVLPEYGIVVDSSYNPCGTKQVSEHDTSFVKTNDCKGILMPNNPLGNALRAPFLWDKVYEIPIPCLYHEISIRYVLPYNFNSSYFLERSVEQCVERHKDYLSKYFKRFGDNAIAVMVMHSWSFLKADSNMHFFTCIPDAPEKFNVLLSELKKDYEFVTMSDIANNLEDEINTVKPEHISINTKEICCPICKTPSNHYVDVFDRPNSHCPNCKSMERQRNLCNLYYANAFGEKAFEDKLVLHFAPGIAEKIMFSKIPNMKIVSADIREEVKVDIHVNISRMAGILDNTFDIVFCSYVFSCVKHFRIAVKEVHRILKPGGLLVCLDYLSKESTTREYTDIKKITAHYGEDLYKKYKVGNYRSFGQDYAEQFKPFFDGVLHPATDLATGSSDWPCFCGKKV